MSREYDEKKDPPERRIGNPVFGKIFRMSQEMQDSENKELDELIARFLFNRTSIKKDAVDGYIDNIRRLIAAGAKPRLERINQAIILYRAEIFNVLIDTPGINLNSTKNPEDTTPLMTAVVAPPLNYETYITLQNQLGRVRPRLTQEVIRERLDENNNKYIIRLLQKKREGANIQLDLQDWNGQTALHRAASLEYPSAVFRVRALLEAGIDPALQDKAGNTAYNIAANDEIRQVIREYYNPNQSQGGRRKYKSHTRRKPYHRRHRTYRK